MFSNGNCLSVWCPSHLSKTQFVFHFSILYADTGYHMGLVLWLSFIRSRSRHWSNHHSIYNTAQQGYR